MRGKNILLIFIAFYMVFMLACNLDKKSHNRLSEQYKSMSINELKLNNKIDTISYALGIVWAQGLKSLEIKGIGSAFYLGNTDYLLNDSSVFSFAKADSFLNLRFAAFKTDTGWPKMNIRSKLGDINISTKYDTVSYALGIAWTRAVKSIGIDSISPHVLLGLNSALNQDSSVFNYEQADKYLRAQVEVLRDTKFGDIKLKNIQWLEENKKVSGVIVLPSGLQYKIIKKGKGLKKPTLSDILTCNYTGKLIDNTIFDSSSNNSEPFKFYLTGVIKGWTEALQLMHEGDVWELYVPYYLGYGSGGVKNKISPFATLIFEIELVSIEKPKNKLLK